MVLQISFSPLSVRITVFAISSGTKLQSYFSKMQTDKFAWWLLLVCGAQFDCTLYSILLQRCSLKQKMNNEKASLKLVNAKVFLCSLVLYRLQELMFWSLCISLRRCLFALFSCMFLSTTSFFSYSIALDHKEKNSMLNVSWYSCYTRIEAELPTPGNFKC